MCILKFILKITRPGVLALTCLAGWPALADVQANQDSLAQANSGFAFDLLKQIAGKQPGGNIFISPYSVSSVLQIVGDGATGATKEEMDHVLHLNGLASPDAACKSLDQSITNGQKDVVLNLANSIWYKQGTELKPEFVTRSANFFHAKTGALDFTSPQSAKIINDWAEKNTHGRIKDVVQWPMNPLTRVILANAIYFKGHWAHEFDKSATKDHAFTGPVQAQTAVVNSTDGTLVVYSAYEVNADFNSRDPNRITMPGQKKCCSIKMPPSSRHELFLNSLN
jgi:serine protease inhibitor